MAGERLLDALRARAAETNRKNRQRVGVYRDFTEWQLDDPDLSPESREQILREQREREQREADRSGYSRLVQRQLARGNPLSRSIHNGQRVPGVLAEPKLRPHVGTARRRHAVLRRRLSMPATAAEG